MTDPVKQEEKRLLVLFKDIDSDKQALCRHLIQNAAFMAVELRKIQTDICNDGTVETYQNGANQSGKKASSSVLAYVKLLSTYHQVIKTLVSLLPTEKTDFDPMAEFLVSK